MPRPQRLPALTGLRFIAAATLVAYHLEGQFGIPKGTFHAFPGHMGVSFFFVLSGFVLTHVHATLAPREVPRFLLARFARMWPAHLAAVGLLWLSPAFQPPPSPPPGATLAAHLLLVQAWVPLPEWNYCWNGVAWSLSTELGFYLLFPLLLYRLDRTWAWKLLLALAVGAALVAAGQALDLPYSRPGAVGLEGLLYIHFLGRLFEFVLGMSLRLALPRALELLRRPAVATLAELGAAGLALGVTSHIVELAQLAPDATGQAGVLWLQTSVGPALAFAPTILVFACGRGWLSAFLSRRAWVLGGEISLSLYLLHQFVLFWFWGARRGFERLGDGGFLLLTLAVTLLGAYVLTAWVERPLRAWLTSLGRPHRGSPSADPAFSRRAVLGVTALFVLGVAGASGFALGVSNVVRLPEAEAKVLARGAAAASRGVLAGNGVELLGAVMERADEGTETVVLLWCARRALSLDQLTAVHLLDAEGKLRAQLDYRQDLARAPVPEGTCWRDRVTLPSPRPEGVVTLGLVLLDAGLRHLPLDRGPRDLEGTRLLVPLD